SGPRTRSRARSAAPTRSHTAWHARPPCRTRWPRISAWRSRTRAGVRRSVVTRTWRGGWMCPKAGRTSARPGAGHRGGAAGARRDPRRRMKTRRPRSIVEGGRRFVTARGGGSVQVCDAHRLELAADADVDEVHPASRAHSPVLGAVPGHAVHAGILIGAQEPGHPPADEVEYT